MKSNRGESRRFAFLGFKSSEDALNVAKYFNGSFINTSKIEVYVAKTFNDPSVPKPMKQRIKEKEQRLLEKEERLKRKQEDELNYQKNKKMKNSFALDNEIQSNPKLREFLEATKHSSKVTSWDDGISTNITSSTTNDHEVVEAQSDDEYEDYNVKSGATEDSEKMMSLNEFGKDRSVSEQSSRDHDAGISRSGIIDQRDHVEKGQEITNFDNEEENDESEDNESKVELESNDKEISNLDWLKKKRKMIVDSNKEKSGVNNKNEEIPEILEENEIQEEKTPLSLEEHIISKIRETGRLFIRNILYSATEQDFFDLFSPYGELEETHIAIDTRTHVSKGFVYIQFKNPEDAVRAYLSLDKQIFQGRLLHILAGDKKKSHKLDEFDLKNMPLKKQRELKRKYEASKSTFSWNSLFLNENAVLESVADKLGINKRDLIDPESSSGAVKQALAEAHIIGDVRKFFESKGIDLTSFGKKERDDKVILIKNFPYGTTESEIVELLSPYGELNRVLFPPSGAICIVEFKDVPAGRSAFTKLSYRRFKKSILYLEKGPKDLFGLPVSEDNKIDTSRINNNNVKEAKLSTDDLMGSRIADTDSSIADGTEEPFAGITASVFVKNLNFKTTSQELVQVFKVLDGFIVAKVTTKPDPKNPGKTLSMGFGFIEFKTKEQANACIQKFDGKVIDEHKIQLKLSHRKSVVGSAKNNEAKGKKSTKIIVKNLPFEATRKDVFDLFNSFGKLKSVRVPKKFNKSARGFAFVEFTLLKEAEHAIDSLKGVHLLGRRLNIEYAEKDSENAEEEIQRMTSKMKRQRNLTDYAKAAKLNGKRRIEMEDDADE